MRSVAAALIVCLLPAVASGFTPYTIDSDPNVPLRWCGMSATLVFDDTAPQELTLDAAMDTVVAAFQPWAAIDCAGTATPYSFDFDTTAKARQVGFDETEGATNENVLTFIVDKSAWPHDKGILALTTLTFSNRTGAIADADMEFNDAFFPLATDGRKTAIDLANTVTHEAGHFLGLNHSSDGSATMFLSAPPGETKKRDLAPDDEEGYCFLYVENESPCTDGTATSCGDTSCAGDRVTDCAASPTAPQPLGLVLIGLACAAVLTVRRRFRA